MKIYYHPLDNGGLKSKLIRAVRDLARGKTYEEYLAAAPALIAHELKIRWDERTVNVFNKVEAEVFGRPYVALKPGRKKFL